MKQKLQAMKKDITPVQKAGNSLGGYAGAGVSSGTPGTFDRFRFSIGTPGSAAPPAGALAWSVNEIRFITWCDTWEELLDPQALIWQIQSLNLIQDS